MVLCSVPCARPQPCVMVQGHGGGMEAAVYHLGF